MSNAKYSDIEALRHQMREWSDRVRKLELKLAEIERYLVK